MQALYNYLSKIGEPGDEARRKRGERERGREGGYRGYPLYSIQLMDKTAAFYVSFVHGFRCS